MLLRFLAVLSFCFLNFLPNLQAQTSQSELNDPTSPLAAFKRAGVSVDSVGLYALALDQTQPRFAHNADTPFILASTTKIITSLAALDSLGPAYRWRTHAYLYGKLENGVLAGDLLIVGSGDPLLDSARLVTWFKQMQKRGLNEIAGNIVIDRNRYLLNDKDHANTPKPDWRNPHHALPNAFVVDEGVIKVKIANVGETKVVTLEPAIDGIDLSDQIQIVARCANIKRALSVDVDEAAIPKKIILTGEWAKDCTPSVVETLPLDQVTFSSAAVLAAFKAAGGTLSGTVTEVPAPVVKTATRIGSNKPPRMQRNQKPRKPFATTESKQLLDAIKEVNKWSNNLVSRNLMLTLAKGFPSIAATMTNAQLAVSDWLLSKGIGNSDISVENGSGLSRNERGKPKAMAELLRDMSFTKIDSAFRSSLSIAGVDGTMSGRLKRADLQGKALLKTGTLTEVRAVCGYVTAKSGQIYAVVAVVNHANAAKALPAIDAFVEWVYAK